MLGVAEGLVVLTSIDGEDAHLLDELIGLLRDEDDGEEDEEHSGESPEG